MLRRFSLSSDNAPRNERFTITYSDSQSVYELTTDGVYVTWAIVTRTNVIVGGDAYEIKSGRENISSGVDAVSVSFASPFASSNYSIENTISNIVDVEPSIYGVVVEDKDANGFDVTLSGVTDSANYVLEWSAVLTGDSSPGFVAGGSGAVGEVNIVDGVINVTLTGFTNGDTIILDTVWR
jgi:hypothetical protein